MAGKAGNRSGGFQNRHAASCPQLARLEQFLRVEIQFNTAPSCLPLKTDIVFNNEKTFNLPG